MVGARCLRTWATENARGAPLASLRPENPRTLTTLARLRPWLTVSALALWAHIALAESQSVSGFALDIQGELVPAVPVPKDKGRQVFDDVTRQRVAPALLERTVGNSFKLRIYPLRDGQLRGGVASVGEVK